MPVETALMRPPRAADSKAGDLVADCRLPLVREASTDCVDPTKVQNSGLDHGASNRRSAISPTTLTTPPSSEPPIEREMATTAQPSLRYACTSAAPIPCDAAVMTATSGCRST
jgi:hypothetical protein